MMSSEEQEAFQLARSLVHRAAREGWKYVCLSPFFSGEAEPRQGFEILEHLTILPEEIHELEAGVYIELRGTSIKDLRPLAHVKQMGQINFKGIPAAVQNEELLRIASISDVGERSHSLRVWLKANKVGEPPEAIEGGPEFVVDDIGPITLVDPPLVNSDDDDQEQLQEECQRKAAELASIVDIAANVAPDLPGAVQKYSGLISRDPSRIGARGIWSIANSLEAALEIHDRAISDNRQSEELPVTVAAKLTDLVQTNRVWFLGHPGARSVEERANRYTKPKDHRKRRDAAISVLEAAEASSAVADEATSPARQNTRTSELNTPAGIAALGELEDWAWNFVASVVRKAWNIARKPPGGFVSQTFAGHYLILFLVTHDDVIRQYVLTVMSHGPMWWDTLCTSIRRLTVTPNDDQDKR